MRRVVLVLAACSSANSAPPLPETPTPAPVGHAPVAPVSRPSPSGSAKNTARISKVRVVAAVGSAAATEHPAYARLDQPVALYAVIEADRVTYTDAPALELRGKPVATRPLAEAPACAIAWNRIEPAQANTTNEDDSGFRFAAIDYRATPIRAGLGSIPADVRPTLTPDHGNGVGTMRFQIVVTQDEHVIASAGPEAHRGKGSGGLTDDVLRVSIRRDDTYLGFLTEMYGQPYVWASAGLTDATHQSERLEGSDCADFIVYGARRMGAALAYTWTGGLPQVTKLLASGTRGPDGVYRDAKGEPLPFGKVGDLILFPRHVGALAEDRGTIGVLDDQDLIMHTLFDSPKEQPIADSGYADKPAELRRFRRDLRPDRSRN